MTLDHAPQTEQDDDTPACDSECGGYIRRYFAAVGQQVHVTHVPPLIPPVYEPLNLRCPHGVPWFAEPTSEQIAEWAAEGVE